MKTRWILALVIFATLFHSFAASGFVVYSTLGDAGQYNSNYAYTIGGGSYVGYQGRANRFVPSAGGLLEGIEVAIGYVSSPELVDVWLTADDGAYFQPGAMLASGSVMTPAPFGSQAGLTLFAPPNPVMLTAGTPYWVAVMPHSGSTYSAWYDAWNGASGATATTHDGGVTWGVNSINPLSAFRVSVVPEPSSVAMGAAALIAAMIARRRRDGMRSAGFVKDARAAAATGLTDTGAHGVTCPTTPTPRNF